jgi:hypothetical protein
MSQLSKDVSGYLVNTVFSSNADKEMPLPFGIMPGQLSNNHGHAPAREGQPAPSVSGLKRATSFNRKLSEPPENAYSTSLATLASIEALQPPSLEFLDLDVSATLNSATRYVSVCLHIPLLVILV